MSLYGGVCCRVRMPITLSSPDGGVGSTKSRRKATSACLNKSNQQHPPNHQDSSTSYPEVAGDSSSPVWLDQNDGRRGRPDLARAAQAIVGNLGRCSAVETSHHSKCVYTNKQGAPPAFKQTTSSQTFRKRRRIARNSKRRSIRQKIDFNSKKIMARNCASSSS